MTRSETTHDEMSTGDYAIATSRNDAAGTARSGEMSENETEAAGSGPAVILASRVTCPDCGTVSKLDWMEKAPHGSGYVSTVLCEACGCFIAVLVGRVSTRVIAHQQDY